MRLGQPPSRWLPLCSDELALELDYFLLKQFEAAADPEVEGKRKIEEMKRAMRKRE